MLKCDWISDSLNNQDDFERGFSIVRLDDKLLPIYIARSNEVKNVKACSFLLKNIQVILLETSKDTIRTCTEGMYLHS